MMSAIQSFIEAHDHCVLLENFLQCVANPDYRAIVRIELLNAYDELERKAQAVVGARFAEGVRFGTASAAN